MGTDVDVDMDIEIEIEMGAGEVARASSGTCGRSKIKRDQSKKQEARINKSGEHVMMYRRHCTKRTTNKRKEKHRARYRTVRCTCRTTRRLTTSPFVVGS